MAQQENAPNKPVHLIYLVGAVVLFYLLQWTHRLDLGLLRHAAERVQDLARRRRSSRSSPASSLYRNDRVYHLANEVAAELKKVTWPTAKEVRAATIVVIVMAIISALILGLFDFVWSNLTELVYG